MKHLAWRRKDAILVFLLIAACPAYLPGADIPCIWTGVEKIIAVGDLHGEYDNFVEILQGTGLVDENLRWTGGQTHLVQTGDIIDRGPEARKIFDLLIRLEKEAQAAGGLVHILLGNHEEANITGIALSYPSFVTVEQFVSFLPREFRWSREKEFIKSLSQEEQKALGGRIPNLDENPRLKEYWSAIMKKDYGARIAYVEGFNETYGRWLLKKNAVIKINETVFVHGGISEKYSTWKLQDINNQMRLELAILRRLAMFGPGSREPYRPLIVYDPHGPLWFRDLAIKEESSSEDIVKKILVDLGAERIVIGHTFWRTRNAVSPIVSLENMSRFGGRVWVIDTGISAFYGGAPAALVIEKNRLDIWGDNDEGKPASSGPAPHASELPETKDIEDFLRKARIAAVFRGAEQGRTEPWRVELEDGPLERQGIFKYVDRRRPGILPDSYAYELAAYGLAKILRLDFVPPVVERTVEDTPGTIQLYIEGTVRESDRARTGPEPPQPGIFHDALEEILVFENLVGNDCRNLEDTRVRTEDWKVFRVDFSEAFHPSAELPPECRISRCSFRLYRGLLDWNRERIRSALGDWLNDDELSALSRRRDLIVERLKTLIYEKGEDAVLF